MTVGGAGQPAWPPGRGGGAGQVPRRILLICHANTCRSVIAEALLRKMLAERGLGERVAVCSAGVAPYARDGALVSMDARLVLRDEGVHVPADAVSTDLKRNRHLAADADLILAMTAEQVRLLRTGFPEADGKPVWTLKEYAGASGDIDDPVDRGLGAYDACRNEIKACLERVLERLASAPACG